MAFETMWIWLIPLVIWTIIWKGIGRWRAGRNDHKIWFVIMFIINSVGIIPIIYLIFIDKFFKKRKRK